MRVNWINPEEYSFNCFLLMERFQIKLMMDAAGWLADGDEWRRNMGIALNANPAVRWYFSHRCPECAGAVAELCENAPPVTDAARVRGAEIYALASQEAFVAYTSPAVMNEKCDFIRGWDSERLFEMADFADKAVLDVGAGTGRLTFAAAEKAQWVYACEPIGTLREFMRERIAKENIINVRVLDGFITNLPFPDDSFDIVMTGHVIGASLNLTAEVAELTRVCKPGGWLLDCPGDSLHEEKPCAALATNGWVRSEYIGSFGKMVYTHRKLIKK